MSSKDKNRRQKKNGAAVLGAGSVLSTMSGPSQADPPASLGNDGPVSERLRQKVEGGMELSAEMPYNTNKAHEYGEAARTPQPGALETPPSDAVTASTSTELNASGKVGQGEPLIGENPTVAPLDRVRVDATGQQLTTNQGVPVANNQDSLKLGLRGPTLMEDFIFREKITHFDHERIPERVVHARGSAAHGVFECYADLGQFTRAAPFSKAGKQTPVFVRFSTVAGERGSADTVRDVRGFAVKFYTDEGNWDLVGNNIPVFFIQDAMKFPDLVHALKPEPHHAMPQASSAHDTFWDFVSLTPESTHMLMWVMSDRAIPRSYRTMQGFGVHTFRLVNQKGESVFCKFHWTPLQGTHSLVWDEAAKISGADPDFHRRDLWEAIEAGEYPQYELGLQIFSEAEAEKFPFDVLDPTKIVPEELVPVVPVGKMTLNRNPDNFFAETEQVAFDTANIIPGIDFSNDPLLQGRNHSYVDTQLTRLSGPNFHEIPINTSTAEVYNNQRDGFHRQAIHRGRVNYEPNSLAGGSPNQVGTAGYMHFPQQTAPVDKVRGRPELFADHFSQARMFWESQSPAERQHIINAYRFELTRVQTPAVRERVVSMLANVDAHLATAVAQGLGMDMPEPMPLASRLPIPEYQPSPALSLMSRPGETGLRTRRVAVLVGPGIDGQAVENLYADLLAEGAVPRLVGAKLGKVETRLGQELDVEVTLETSPSVLYDAVVVPGSGDSSSLWMEDVRALEFVRDQFRHCKPMLFTGSDSAGLLEKAGIPVELGIPLESGIPVTGKRGQPDLGVYDTQREPLDQALAKFKAALSGHRAFEREDYLLPM